MAKDFTQFEYKNVSCHICGGNDYSVVHHIKDKYNEGPITFVKCNNDGLIYQNPCPTTDSLFDFFNTSSFSSLKNTDSAKELTGYVDYYEGELFRKKMATERLSFINKMTSNRKLNILKIAPGTGILLKLAKDLGHNETGIDISKEFVEYAKEKYEINMIHSSFDDWECKDETFDVVLLFGAFLNFHNPKDTLLKIRRLLKPNGQLHINHNSSDNWLYKLQGANYFCIRPPVVSFFNRSNFVKFLDSVGFKTIYNKQEWQYSNFTKLSNFSKINTLVKITNFLGIHKKIIKIPVPGATYVVATK